MKPLKSPFAPFPFLRLTALFILGIIVAELAKPSPVWLNWLFVGSILFILISLKRIKESILKDRMVSAVLILSILFSGFYYTQLYKGLQFKDHLPAEGLFSGIVYEKVPSTENRFKYTVKLQCYKEKEILHRTNEKILVYYSDSMLNKNIEPGSEIYFKTQLREIENNKNPGEFDFKRYMNRKGIRYQAFVKDSVYLSKTRHNNPVTLALNIRTKLMALYKNAGISGDEYAVLGALTLGDQNYISNEVKSYFAASGAMHVLSVSGLHIAIIFYVLTLLVKPLEKSKKLKPFKVLILLGFLWIYAFITGLAPSVLRSTSMFSFLVIGQNINRRTNTYNILAVSAFSILLLNPLILFDVGFQLSYLAVLSILFFQPRIATLIKTETIVSKYIWDLVTVSIAAQLGTTPLSIYYFNQFPTYFLVSNLIVVPVSAIILYLGMIFFVVSFIPFLNEGIAFLLKYLMIGFNFSVKTIESLPGSVIEGISVSVIGLLLLYLLISSLSHFIITRRGSSLIIALSTIAILLFGDIISVYQCSNQNKIIVYNNRPASLISFIHGRNHYYYSNSDTLLNYSKQMLKSTSALYNTRKAKRLTTNPNEKSVNSYQYVKFNNLRISVIDKKNINALAPNDTTMIYDRTKSTIRLIMSNKYKIEPVKNDSTVNIIPGNQLEYNLKKSGALIIDL